MKMVLELSREPKENDILVYQEGKWMPVNSKVFYSNDLHRISDVEKLITLAFNNMSELNDRIDALQHEINVLKGEE